MKNKRKMICLSERDNSGNRKRFQYLTGQLLKWMSSLEYIYAIAASIPYQAKAELCLINIPDTGSVPDYVECGK